MVQVDFDGVRLTVDGGEWETHTPEAGDGLADALVRTLNVLALEPSDYQPDFDHWVASEGARLFGGRVLDVAREAPEGRGVVY